MNAIEALQALRDGKKIRHIRADEGEYWHIKKNGFLADNSGESQSFIIFGIDDIVGNRWELFSTYKEKEYRNLFVSLQSKIFTEIERNEVDKEEVGEILNYLKNTYDAIKAVIEEEKENE